MSLLCSICQNPHPSQLSHPAHPDQHLNVQTLLSAQNDGRPNALLRGRDFPFLWNSIPMEILPCLRKLQLPSHVYMQVLILIVWTETASLPAFLPATDIEGLEDLIN